MNTNRSNKTNRSSKSYKTDRSNKSNKTNRSDESIESDDSTDVETSDDSNASTDSNTSNESSITTDSSKKKSNDGLRVLVTMKDQFVLGLVKEEVLLQITILSLAGNCSMLTNRVCFLLFFSPIDGWLDFSHRSRRLHKQTSAMYGALARADGLRIHRRNDSTVLLAECLVTN